MSGAQESLIVLRLGAMAQHDAVRNAVTAYGHAARTFLDATAEGGDLVVGMSSVPALIFAAEAMEAAASAIVRDARRALAEQMMMTGATTLRTEFHTISAMDPPRRVRIIDPALIPVGFTYQPPRKPDEKAISSALRAGEPVAGCELSNGGPVQLRIVARKSVQPIKEEVES